MEFGLNEQLGPIKADFAALSSVQPIELNQPKYYEASNRAAAFHADEVQIKLGQIDDQSINSKISTLCKVYTGNYDSITESVVNPMQKHRLLSKLNEDCIYLVLLNRYFKVIAKHFQLHEHKSGQIMTIPMVCENKDDSMGLIMTPDEISLVLGPQIKNDYSTYLLALLRLVDTIVDYTSEVIIKINISQTEVTKHQYSLAVVNSQLISKLQNGFQLLDLKNDSIRRKYDGLKYLVKKINNIVYDLSLRNLIINDARVI